MYVRPVRRICDVRGCKNKDCFSISRVKEAGNTPIICKSCLGMALSALDEPEVVRAQEKKPMPKLFFNTDAFPKTKEHIEPLEEEKPKTEDGNQGDVTPDGQKEPKTEETTNPPSEEGEGVKVVPDENVENLIAPSETSEKGLTEEKPSVEAVEKAPEEEKPKTKRATKKGDK